jgi:glyoxylase-like metal-dependent hydrolase (beta-lactamase superfamily II)
MPHQAERIVKEIRALGRSPEEVRLIVLTHGHIDHAGSAAALKRLTHAPILMHRADLALVETHTLKIPPGRNRWVNGIGWLMRRFGWVVPLETFTPDICPEDGDSLDRFGMAARVIHTPGHTAGSITLLLEDGTAFVGDAILNLAHVAFPLWWEDPAAASKSACRIRSLQPRLCYSGHGRPFSGDELSQFVSGYCQ